MPTPAAAATLSPSSTDEFDHPGELHAFGGGRHVGGRQQPNSVPTEVANDLLPPTLQTPYPPTPDPLANVGYLPVAARRVTGTLDPIISRHYLALDSDIRDDIVRLSMTFNPADIPGTVGQDQLLGAGRRRLPASGRAMIRDFNVATGFPSPVSEEDNVLLASFRPSGEYNYNVVVFNRSQRPRPMLWRGRRPAPGQLRPDQRGQGRGAGTGGVDQFQRCPGRQRRPPSARPMCSPAHVDRHPGQCVRASLFQAPTRH
ncbi:MAG: hypothetical protein R2854_16130 [Caldilineaceae bacterium]